MVVGMGAHAQLFRDALHALSLGAAAFALFGDGALGTNIAYIVGAAVLHFLAHVVIEVDRTIQQERAGHG
ncbi:hypothetical protein GCM10007417_24250 [Glycocaulis alkaliphilus]|nr:hypothetical protein GCM10007417_24250 [Glycocaulis alkaliphilus]